MRGTVTVIEEQVCRSFGDYLNHLNHFNHNNRGGVAALRNSSGKKNTVCTVCILVIKLLDMIFATCKVLTDIHAPFLIHTISHKLEVIWIT